MYYVQISFSLYTSPSLKLFSTILPSFIHYGENKDRHRLPGYLDRSAGKQMRKRLVPMEYRRVKSSPDATPAIPGFSFMHTFHILGKAFVSDVTDHKRDGKEKPHLFSYPQSSAITILKPSTAQLMERQRTASRYLSLHYTRRCIQM